MADRIVAMHHGVVQQIGTPLEIYDRPANIFVASFIGSPAMNFIPGAYRPIAEGAAVRLGGKDFAIPGRLPLDDGARILAGIRPEHLGISDDPKTGLAGQIELVEPMGLTTLVHVSAAGQSLKALSFKRLPLKPGMPVGVIVDMKHAQLFDPATEQRIN